MLLGHKTLFADWWLEMQTYQNWYKSPPTLRCVSLYRAIFDDSSPDSPHMTNSNYKGVGGPAPPSPYPHSSLSHKENLKVTMKLCFNLGVDALLFYYLLLFYVLATSKIISGHVSSCDSAHSRRLYSAAPLGNHSTLA